jgi:D-serine deaminase-like pyridoxal phosphate-dependent protein
MPSTKAFLSTLETPALVVHRDILAANLRDMADFTKEQGVALRPHTKTHKCPELARRQLALGACGIAVAKLSEAQVMARAGIRDIKIANEVVDPEKMHKLARLAEDVTLTVAVDNRQNAEELSQVMSQEGAELDVLIDIDIGYHRTGLPHRSEQRLIRFARLLSSLPCLNFKGIMTHAGQAYGAKSTEDLTTIGLHEGRRMAELGQLLRGAGVDCETVSVGSTPTAKISGAVPGVTELRPGNYLFKDAIQMSLGVGDVGDCALRVLAQVSSLPSVDRVIIDTGSKSLGPEKLGNPGKRFKGLGFLVGKKAQLTNLTEEHGFIKRIASGEKFELGEKIEIIPNHACFTVNLYDSFVSVPDGHVYRVEGRGYNR